MFKIPIDKQGKMDIILRATGYGLRATGYGLRATGYGRPMAVPTGCLIANVNPAGGVLILLDMNNFFSGFPLRKAAVFFWRNLCVYKPEDNL